MGCHEYNNDPYDPLKSGECRGQLSDYQHTNKDPAYWSKINRCCTYIGKGFLGDKNVKILIFMCPRSKNMP
jgi:hypothetical protein